MDNFAFCWVPYLVLMKSFNCSFLGGWLENREQQALNAKSQPLAGFAGGKSIAMAARCFCSTPQAWSKVPKYGASRASITGAV